jgi:fimbrial isopeptide formation D2 family protein
MRPAWLNRNASRRNQRTTGRKASRLGLAVKGGLASALALAGLVVFATAASAHSNGQQSVSAVCGTAPTLGAAGDGATLTWTLFNNWPQTETGTYSTTQGTLSTHTLSVAASPAEHSSPPLAANQSFTQSLTATELAALSPSSTITVAWTSTWTDGTQGSGMLTTTLAALDLPNGCVPQKTSPTIATTLVPPTSTTLGNSWSDIATVAGRTGSAAPAGSVAFSVCKASSSTSTCLSGGSPVGAVSSPSSTSGNVSTYNLAPKTYTPSSVGTYCYYAVYTPTESEPYLAASGPAECFAVTTAAPNFTVVKTDVPTSGTRVAIGSTIDYTVAIKNVGNDKGAATVTDVVPSSLTVNKTPVPACAVTGSDTCSIANTTGSTWTFSVNLAGGDTATVTFAATVVSSTSATITNTATITEGPCTTSAGCSSSVSNPIGISTAAAVVTPTATPPATLAATTSPKTSPSTTTLAATGALLTQEWMVGLVALMLGSGLVLLARWRRRIPRHAASKK